MTMPSTSAQPAIAAPAPAGAPLRWGLWLTQALMFLAFSSAGWLKLTKAPGELASSIPWAADVPLAFLRFIGGVDLAGGVGVLLPALTRVAPRLTVAAAIGCATLQGSAIVFHAVRGEYVMLPVNVTLLAMAVFVAWGRSYRVPV